MKKIIKPVGIIFGILALFFIGIVIFVHVYLTDERIKTLIIPPAEEALGRNVAIGDITVGIFSGITIHDFIILETDAKQPFVKIGRFILRYELLPLLQKQLVISQVHIADPVILVARDKNGKFNFETLKILAAEESAPDKQSPADSASQPGGLPLALTVEDVRLENAIINVMDAKNELPATTAEVNSQVALAISAEGALTYQGDLKAKLTAKYGALQPKALLTGKFDQQHLNYDATIDLEDQKIKVNGRVSDYAANPEILLNVLIDTLNINKLAALPDKLPKTPPAKQATSKKTAPSAPAKNPRKKEPAAATPPIHGKVVIKQATYDKLNITNFSLSYTFMDYVLNVKDLVSDLADGKVSGETRLDLNHPDMKFHGKLAMQSLQIRSVLEAFAPKVADTVSGKVSAGFDFAGQSFEWQKLRNNLHVDGTFTFMEGRFHDTPLTTAIAGLTGLEEVKQISFKESDGKIQIRQGRARLASSISGSDISAEGNGYIGLDGKLDYPLTMRFSPQLSAKLKRKASFSQYLVDESGETTLHLKIKGTIDKPRPTIDTKSVQKQAEKQIKKEVKKKAQEELDRAIKKHLEDDAAPLKDAAQDLLDKLFGK